MPLLYREIRLPRWIINPSLALESDFPCDCFGDLATSSSKLSFWLQEQGEQEIEDIAVAVAANKQTVRQVELLGIEPKVVTEIGVALDHASGTSNFGHANSLHRDVSNLSAFKLVRLANRMVALGQIRSFLPKKVAQLLRKRIDSGLLDQSKLQATLVQSIHKYAG